MSDFKTKCQVIKDEGEMLNVNNINYIIVNVNMARLRSHYHAINE